MIIIVIFLAATLFWFEFKFNTRSINQFSSLLAKGANRTVSPESNYIQCSSCNNVVKRCNTATYCAICRVYL